MLKNTLVYYLFILLPFAALLYLAKAADSTTFVIALFSYIFYRFIIDRLRLLHKGVLTRDTFWKLYFPGLQATYFKELYLP